MSKQNEFGEPWRVDGDSIMMGKPADCITVCGGESYDAGLPDANQMERIVACINFLAGVPTAKIVAITNDPTVSVQFHEKIQEMGRLLTRFK